MACSGGGGDGQRHSHSPSPATIHQPPSCSNTLGIPDHPLGRVRMYLDADVPGPDGQLPYMKLYSSASDDEEDEDFEEELHEADDSADEENVDPNEVDEGNETDDEIERISRQTQQHPSTSVPSQSPSMSGDRPEPVDVNFRSQRTKRRSSPDESDHPSAPKTRKPPEKD